jgi:hypothetical protein
MAGCTLYGLSVQQNRVSIPYRTRELSGERGK